MMTREDIRELAAFQADSDGCALSFYFQPRTPQNKSHKEESILAKDLVRQAMREAEKQGKNSCARADLDRILEIAGNLRGNQAKAKAVFASSTKKLWREFDLPPYLPGTQLFVNRRFHLKPLAALPGIAESLYLRSRVVSVTRQGIDKLKAAYNPKLDPFFSVATVPPYTHYTPEQLIACKGP